MYLAVLLIYVKVLNRRMFPQVVRDIVADQVRSIRECFVFPWTTPLPLLSWLWIRPSAIVPMAAPQSWLIRIHALFAHGNWICSFRQNNPIQAIPSKSQAISTKSFKWLSNHWYPRKR